MVKNVILYLFLLLSTVLLGQNVVSPKSTAITTNFSMASVKVYQESGTLKIQDFYHYLNLFSSDDTETALKYEIKNSIYSLFESANVLVVDVTTNDNQSISLTDLLNKIGNKNYHFSISNIENSIAGLDFWTSKYELKVSQGSSTNRLQVYQKIIFKPIQKKFGTSTKEVWTLFLDEIQL